MYLPVPDNLSSVYRAGLPASSMFKALVRLLLVLQVERSCGHAGEHLVSNQPPAVVLIGDFVSPCTFPTIPFPMPLITGILHNFSTDLTPAYQPYRYSRASSMYPSAILLSTTHETTAIQSQKLAEGTASCRHLTWITLAGVHWKASNLDDPLYISCSH